MLEQNDNTKEITLRSLRESLGYSQESFAAKVHLTRNAVMRYEQGLAEPKASNFISMARELGVPLKTLARAMKYDVTGIPDDCDYGGNQSDRS